MLDITGFKTEPKPAILQVPKVWIAGSSVAEISFRVHRFVKLNFVIMLKSYLS
jgi:hypothetical protein